MVCLLRVLDERTLLYLPCRHFKAQDILDLGDHVLVHLVRQVANGQEQILHVHVRGVAAEDDVGRRNPHIFLVHSLVLMIHTVQRQLDLGGGRINVCC